MRRSSVAVFAVCALLAASPLAVRAQSTDEHAAMNHAALSHDELMTLVKAHVAIGVAHDSTDAQLAQMKNKKPEAQQALRDQLSAQIATILKQNGLTQADYERKIYLVSTNADVRKEFDAAVAQATGVPTPGQLPPTPPKVLAVPVADLPPGAVGTHIGHVVNSFNGTPGDDGLLPTAIAEAKVAAQHAALAGRNPANLDAMKLHAGHVINALDPSIQPAGPGLGYGVKKAATGVATHIELAAKSPGASPNVTMHAAHVATAARNTVQRADSIIAIAKRIQASTSAADAAALVSQMASMADQLMAGADANGDGRVSVEEGGLQVAQDHVKLLISGEKKKP